MVNFHFEEKEKIQKTRHTFDDFQALCYIHFLHNFGDKFKIKVRISKARKVTVHPFWGLRGS